MKLNIVDQFNPINENAIFQFESDIKHMLPEGYKEFLLECNGGRPTPNLFKTADESIGSDVQFFWGINTNKIYDLRNRIDSLPDDCVIIANDSSGNHIVLNFKTEQILFWDHETGFFYSISKSWDKFIASLYDEENVFSSFDEAVVDEDIGFFEEKIREGVHVDDIVNEFDQTLLQVAIVNDKVNLVNFCLRNGASVQGLLVRAVRKGNLDIIKSLVSHGADVNEREGDLNNDTPLTIAGYVGNADVVKYLIDAGAEVYATDKHGHNLMNKAIWSGNQHLVDYLELAFPMLKK